MSLVTWIYLNITATTPIYIKRKIERGRFSSMSEGKRNEWSKKCRELCQRKMLPKNLMRFLIWTIIITTMISLFISIVTVWKKSAYLLSLSNLLYTVAAVLKTSTIAWRSLAKQPATLGVLLLCEHFSHIFFKTSISHFYSVFKNCLLWSLPHRSLSDLIECITPCIIFSFRSLSNSLIEILSLFI
jgi:hypothetical protein